MSNTQSKDVAPCTKGLVVILHGILRSKMNMRLIEKHFKNKGFSTLNIQYPSRKKSIEALSDFVNKEILSSPNYSRDTKLYFVTHSMGGLIARYYIAQYKPTNLKEVVMLGPPNSGSELANWLSETKFLSPIFKAVFGPAGQQLRTDYAHIDSPINYPLGIIAGSKYINPLSLWVLDGEHDGAVPVKRTQIEGMSDHVVIPTNHSFMMFNNEVIDQTLYFIDNGHFRRP